MLDLLTVGPTFARPACRSIAAAIDLYLQTRHPPTDGTDRRIFDRFMTLRKMSRAEDAQNRKQNDDNAPRPKPVVK